MTDRQTDAIERQLSRGEALTPAQAEHARECPTCRATVAAAGRLETSLPNVVRRMVVEPLPPADELLAAAEVRRPWRGIALLAGAGAAAVLVAAVVVGGRLIGLSGLAPGLGPSETASPGIPQTGAVPDDMAAWVAEAGGSIWDHMDRGLPAPDLPLIRLERCGDTALAFFADPQASSDGSLLFGSGDYRQPPFGASSGGVATSLDDPEAAYARTQLDSCDVVVDTAIDPEDVMDMLFELYGDVRPLATKMVTGGTALVYADGVDRGVTSQLVMVIQDMAGGNWTNQGSQGGDYPVGGSAVGVTPLGVAKGMPDDRWAAVGRTDDNRVVAVELDFDGFPHRYPFSDGAFVIQLPEDVGFELPYRLLDADGNIVAEGVSQP